MAHKRPYLPMIGCVTVDNICKNVSVHLCAVHTALKTYLCINVLSHKLKIVSVCCVTMTKNMDRLSKQYTIKSPMMYAS